MTAAAALTIAACGSSGSSGNAAVAGSPKDGGNLTFLI